MIINKLLTLPRVVITVLVMIIFTTPVFAQPGRTACPDACATKCEVDILCQNKLLFDRKATCDPFVCNTPTATEPTSAFNLNIFGINIRLNSEQAVQQIIVLSFSLFLGAVALAGVFIGLIAAAKRSNTTDPKEIANLTLTMRNAIVGVVLVALSIAFVQIVASFIGVGNIFNMVNFSNFIPDEGDFK